MTTYFTNVQLLNAQGELELSSITVENGKVTAIGGDEPAGAQVIDGSGNFVSPGFVDVHVHLREPGFEHKETIETGTAAAARRIYNNLRDAEYEAGTGFSRKLTFN